MIRLLIAVVVTVFVTNVSSAHEIFQDVLKEHYGLKSFACKTCHPDGDDRSIRTVFADLIADEMKDGNWTERFHQAEAEGEDAVAEFEKLIAKEFEKTIGSFGERTLTVDQLMESGLLTGVRLDPKKQKDTRVGKGSKPIDSRFPLALSATLLGGLWVAVRRIRL